MLCEHGPQAEYFHRFFEFSQTFTSVSTTRQKHGGMFSISFRKHCDEKKENDLLTLIIKM